MNMNEEVFEKAIEEDMSMNDAEELNDGTHAGP